METQTSWLMFGFDPVRFVMNSLVLWKILRRLLGFFPVHFIPLLFSFIYQQSYVVSESVGVVNRKLISIQRTLPAILVMPHEYT